MPAAHLSAQGITTIFEHINENILECNDVAFEMRCVIIKQKKKKKL